MRCRGWLLAAALVVGLTGCGDDDDADDVAAGAATAPSVAASAVTGTAGGAGATALKAAVGQAGDPDAFVLTVQDASGADVTTLPAGEYEIQVSDPSTIHNVHLTGAGVDETTTVPETGDVTWTVTLEAGTYVVVCDPHAKMRVEIAVT